MTLLKVYPDAEKNDLPRDLKTDIRATQKSRGVRFSEEISRCVAVVAAADRDEIFAVRSLRIVGSCHARL
jgi:hypothetical protein